MSNDDMTPHQALITLHKGLKRLGPGDQQLSLDLLRRLPKPPFAKSIADLGCGTGAGSLLLAQFFQQSVLCIDTSQEFLDELSERAARAGLGHLITPLCADMGALDPETYRFDLLWSEGAAYNLTFAGAVQKWRPHMLTDGIAVISELSWFTRDPAQEALDFWSAEYPDMASEFMNTTIAEQSGFKTLFTERLPAQAWWDNYYTPLAARMKDLEGSESETLQAAIAGTRKEMDLFRKHSDDYGYTFYVLQAV